MPWGLRLPPFARTTTFRLSLLYLGLILLYSAALIGFIYTTTVGYIRAETQTRIEAEIDSIVLAYNQGGLSRVTQSLFERAAVPNRYFLYHLETPSGIKLSGDLSDMPPEVSPGRVSFQMDMRRPGGTEFTINVEGQVVNLGTDARLLVAFDTGERSVIVTRITNAIYIAAGVGLLLSLIGGIWISRGVARRAEQLADTAELVMDGNLAVRAPQSGLDDEFDRLAEQLNAMLDRLQALVKASRHTGDAIAHDLRSPLSRMRNRLEDAQFNTDNADATRLVITETIDDVDGVLATFNAILRLSRLDAHAGMRLVRTDMNELVEELAELFGPAAEEQGLWLTSAANRVPPVRGDREMIAQAMSNLIDNAIKYTPPGGSILISALSVGEHMVEITIKDTGYGIPEIDRERAKQRFERMDKARTRPGSGLGLAMVDGVAMVHRGEFELLDGDGPPEQPGLRAVLRLPRA